MNPHACLPLICRIQRCFKICHLQQTCRPLIGGLYDNYSHFLVFCSSLFSFLCDKPAKSSRSWQEEKAKSTPKRREESTSENTTLSTTLAMTKVYTKTVCLLFSVIFFMSTHKQHADHISIASSESSASSSQDGTEHKEEDFISLNTEVDNRSRQQRRSDERAGMKRKRDDDNDADDYDDSLLCYPWMDLMGSNRLKQPLSAIRLLQREVTCFVQYVEPTKIEIKMREYLVHRIRTAVQAKWPSATVSVFGSFSTTLYLPNSDIDLVVQFPPSTQLRLRTLASTLVQDDICRDPQVIEHASVSRPTHRHRVAAINQSMSFFSYRFQSSNLQTP